MDCLSQEHSALLLEVCSAPRPRVRPEKRPRRMSAFAQLFARPAKVKAVGMVVSRKEIAESAKLRRKILRIVRRHSPGLAANPNYVSFLERCPVGRLRGLLDRTQTYLR